MLEEEFWRVSPSITYISNWNEVSKIELVQTARCSMLLSRVQLEVSLFTLRLLLLYFTSALLAKSPLHSTSLPEQQ